MYSLEVIEKSIRALDTQQLIERWKANQFSEESLPIAENELRQRGIDPSGPMPEPAKSETKTLQGVGGWLSWLVFAMCILRPILSFGSLESSISAAESNIPNIVLLSGWIKYKTIIWSVVTVANMGSIFGGILLLSSHKRSSVYIAITVLWLVNLGTVFADYSAASFYLAQHQSFSVSVYVVAAFQAIMVAGVWTLYLLLSKRVKNTYLSGSG